MIKKLKNFLKYDIRIKLIKISNLTRLPLYPKIFDFKGIKKIYHYFVFELIFISKALKKRRILKNKIKNEIISNKNTVNIIASSPASGSTFIRSCLKSYFEIYFKAGNGIPKYDSVNNLWSYNTSEFVKGGDLYNFIDLDIPSSNPNKSKLFWSSEFFNKNKVFFTRYPFGRYDLSRLNNIKPVVLIREPQDWVLSYYISQKNLYDEKKSSDRINEFLIDHSLKRIKSYYDFWSNFSNKHEKCLIIEFKSLNENPLKIFEKICLYFNYDISNKDIINKCIEYNSKEFMLKNLGVDFHGTRFTKPGEKEKIIDKINPYIEKYIKTLKVDESYLSIQTKSSKII